MQKNMRYAHFVEICENAAISELCGNRIFTSLYFFIQQFTIQIQCVNNMKLTTAWEGAARHEVH